MSNDGTQGMKSVDVIIIGAGISGLTCAFNLHKRGKEVCVLEHSDHIGGAIRSERIDGYLVEAGPNSTLETTPLLAELMDASGCKADLRYADARSDTRYILKNGKLTPLPMSPAAFVKTKLFSLSAKLRLFKEPFIPPSPASANETIADFVKRRLGQEFLDYAINPFVAGVYAGSPEHLSVRAAFPKLHALEQQYGSLIKGQIKGARARKHNAEKSKQSAKLFSFHDGMETLPRALAQHLSDKITTGCRIEQISIQRDSEQNHIRYIVSMKRGEELFQIEAASLILSVPAYAASELLSPLSAEVAATLQAIPYPPCSVVVTLFKREDVRDPLNGFGYLIPQKENRKILGTIFTSTIFSNRCPDDRVMLTSFVGGSRSPELALLPKEKLQSLVLLELAEILGVSAKPQFVYITQWERAIPQYNLEHLKRMAVLDRFESKHHGFFFCANYRGGISLGDCVKSANEAAHRALEYLSIKSQLAVV